MEKPKPELTSDRSCTALTGNSVTLYCTLKLQSAGWKFYWSKDTQRRETKTETHSYTIRSVSVSDGGQYRCRAGRGNPVYYTNYSDALWVNVSGEYHRDKTPAYAVNVNPDLHHFISTEKPTLTVNVTPQSFIYTGETVTLNCNLQSTGWSFSWYEGYEKSPEPQNTNPLSVIISNEGQTTYYCKALRGNYESNFSAAARITVKEKPKPELTSDIKGAALTGNPVVLNCTLKLQSAGWKFYWSKDTQRRETETKTGHFFFRSVSVSDGGQYWCRAGRGNPVYYTHYSDALWVNVTGEYSTVVVFSVVFICLRVNE
ncbi:Fc receptor-like protein 5 [Silurus meridionalis]|nr:Fc receptor-like protein 5 [Silurus meridionalis]